MRILNFGSLNIDRVYRVDTFVAPGETKSAVEYTENCGGKGLNQSIAAARAGASVCHAGLFGTDGAMLRAALLKNGVDVSLMENCDGASGHAVIEVEDGGQNRILLFGGANRRMTEKYVLTVLDAFGGEGVVMLQNETSLVPFCMREAARRGLTVVFNAAPMREDVKNYPLECCGMLIVNEVEGRAIAGCEREEDILDVLRKRYPDCGVLLTLGVRGAFYEKNGNRAFVPSHRVKAVDTTAAGDTFTGYFLAALLEGQSTADALRIAAAAAAVCVTRRGAAPSIPVRREVEEALKNGSLSRLTVDESVCGGDRVRRSDVSGRVTASE